MGRRGRNARRHGRRCGSGDRRARELSGAHGIDDAAAAYGTAFWWSVAITAVAIIPCIVLVRAERKAREASRADSPPLPIAEQLAESAA